MGLRSTPVYHHVPAGRGWASPRYTHKRSKWPHTSNTSYSPARRAANPRLTLKCNSDAPPALRPTVGHLCLLGSLQQLNFPVAYLSGLLTSHLPHRLRTTYFHTHTPPHTPPQPSKDPPASAPLLASLLISCLRTLGHPDTMTFLSTWNTRWSFLPQAHCTILSSSTSRKPSKTTLQDACLLVAMTNPSIFYYSPGATIQ